MLDAAFSITVGIVINPAVTWASILTDVSFLAARIRSLHRTDADCKIILVAFEGSQFWVFLSSDIVGAKS